MDCDSCGQDCLYPEDKHSELPKGEQSNAPWFYQFNFFRPSWRCMVFCRKCFKASNIQSICVRIGPTGKAVEHLIIEHEEVEEILKRE